MSGWSDMPILMMDEEDICLLEVEVDRIWSGRLDG